MRLFLLTILLCVGLLAPDRGTAQTNGTDEADDASATGANAPDRADEEPVEQVPESEGEGADEAEGDVDVSEEDEERDGSEEEDVREEGDNASDTGADAEAADQADGDPFEDFDELGPARPEVGRPSFGGRPLELMTRSELSDAGFDFGDQTEGQDTSTALLLSLTAGIAVHGIGHFYLGDTRTAWFILGMQGLGLGLMASAASYVAVTESAHPATSFIGPMLQAGAALFVYSYLLDVIGVLNAGEQRLARNTSMNRGFGFRARYGFFDAAGFPIRHAIDAQIAADVGGFYASARTMQDVFLDGDSYGARIGIRPVRGDRPLTFFLVEAGGEYLQWQGLGEFGYFSADGRLGGSYQLGQFFGSIDEVAIGAEVGMGNRWYQMAPQGSTTFELAHTRLWVPFDVWASVNVSERLNLRGGYGSSELSLVPALHPLLGVTHLEFLYRGTSYGDISLRAEVGDGIAIFLGGSLWFGR